MRKTRTQPQYDLFYNDPVYTWRGISTLVGDFFEHLTAQLFEGYRVSVEEELGNNPDVETISGRILESKATRRGYWKITLEQLGRMVGKPGAYYVLWRYKCPASTGPLHRRFQDRKALYDFLAANLSACYVISPRYVRRLLHGSTKDWGPAGDHYRCIREVDLLALFDGHSKLRKAQLSLVKKSLKYLAWRLPDVAIYRIDDGSEPPVIPF